MSEDPDDGWWVYTLTGDPEEVNAWFDLPYIGISNDELFITGNLYTDDNEFIKPIIFQIEKEEGYFGGNMDWVYYREVLDAHGFHDFSLMPISDGFGNPHGPGISLISSDSGGGSQIMLYTIDNNAENTPQMSVTAIDVDPYSLGGNGLQLDSDDLIQTNDTRMQSGFFSGETIHFTFQSEYENGYFGLHYGRININELSVETSTFGLEGFDYCYPSIAAIGENPTDKGVVLGFLRTSSSVYPQFRVVTCDENMDWSASRLVKDGESFVNFSSEEIERWGDYSGAARKYNSSPPQVWLSGCYADNLDGGESNILTTWIAQIMGEEAEVSPPIADFTVSESGVIEGTGVNFTDLSTNNPTSWSWTFEGGSPSTSTDQNPGVIYGTAGIYTVTLTSSNAGGSDTETKFEYISVESLGAPPIADFTVSESGIIEGTGVNFTDLSTNNPTSWSWTFEGGSPATSTDQNPGVIYGFPGTYDVILTSSNFDGSDTKVKSDYITVTDISFPPVSNFIVSDTDIIEGTTVQFTDVSANEPLNWSWTFEGGSPATSTDQNPSVTYTTSGIFDVTLTTSNFDGTDTEVKSDYITVSGELMAPVADFTVSESGIIEGTGVNFTDLSTNNPTSWSWTF